MKHFQIISFVTIITVLVAFFFLVEYNKKQRLALEQQADAAIEQAMIEQAMIEQAMVEQEKAAAVVVRKPAKQSAVRVPKTSKKISSWKEVLSGLQAGVSLQKTVPSETGKTRPGEEASMRGLKQVQADVSSVESDYTIPSGDVILDHGAVGELGPEDDLVY